MSDKIVKRFLLSSLERLEQQNIEYVVLRNAEELDEPLPGTDIDIVIRREDVELFEQTLDDRCREQNGVLIMRGSAVRSRHSFYFLGNDEEATPTAIVDLKVKVHHRDIELISSDHLLQKRRRWGKVWRPSYAHESAALLFHAVLDKGYVRRDYCRRILELREKDRQGFTRVLWSQIPMPDAEWAENCLDGGAFGELAQRDRWIGALVSKRPTRRWSLLMFRLRHILHTWRLALKRRGVLVVIVAPDGTGKSTLIKALSEALIPLPLKVENVYFGVRTPFLPTKKLSRYLRYGRKSIVESSGGSTPEPYRTKSLANFLGAAHNLVDQFFRYWLFVRPSLARGRIVLCDRYFFDAMTNPAPGFLNSMLEFVMEHFVPSPDLTIVLYGDADEIHSRKPELSAAEIKRQLEQYSVLCQHPYNGVKVAVDKLPDEIAHNLVIHIIRAYGKRNG